MMMWWRIHSTPDETTKPTSEPMRTLKMALPSTTNAPTSLRRLTTCLQGMRRNSSQNNRRHPDTPSCPDRT